MPVYPTERMGLFPKDDILKSVLLGFAVTEISGFTPRRPAKSAEWFLKFVILVTPSGPIDIALRKLAHPHSSVVTGCQFLYYALYGYVLELIEYLGDL